MAISKYANHNYTSGIPYNTGDRYYAQDLGRDFNFLRNEAGQVLKDLSVNFPVCLSGGVTTQGSGANLNITAGYGYVKKDVTIPNTFASLPPSTTTGALESVRVSWGSLTNFNGSSSGCSSYLVADGGTTWYVKVKYAEANGNTRTRAKKAGSYSYEVTPFYDFVVDSVAPTAYDLCLGTLTSSGGTYTITSPYASHELSINRSVTIGQITEYAGSSAPDSSWKICDGSAISRTTYATLFARLSTTFGVGDGSTTFNIPDLRGSAPQGVGTASGYTQAETIALGTKYNDNFQGFGFASGESATGAIVNIGEVTCNVFAGTSHACDSYRTTAGSSVVLIGDGGNGSPRTGSVTRGKSVGLNFIIKVI